MQAIRPIAIFAASLMFAAASYASPSERTTSLPGDSIYQWTGVLTDQEGRAQHLVEKRGKPVLISMFYNSCQYVCPMLVDTIRMTEKQLTASERNKLQIILVTFDPERDNVAVLKTVFTQRALEAGHWTLARASQREARKLAALLGIQYRRLGNGEFNHSSELILLDAEGRIAARSRQIGTVDPEFLKTLQQATDR